MASAKGIGLARVAEAAGVTTATVSNVINRPHLVAPATQAKVHAAMAELDFVPNRAASTLRKGYSRLLGVVVPEVLNPFYAAITEAIADAASRQGYAVALCVSHDDAALEREQLEMLAEHRVAGVLLVPRAATGTQLRQLRMVGARLVLVDRLVDDEDGCSVVIDDVAGGRLAAEHLLDSQPSGTITLVNGPLTLPQCVDRRNGVLAELDARGLSRDLLVEFESPTMTVEDGVRIGHLLAASPAPRQIFCTNDQLAIGVIRGLRAEGLKVPDDALIVGYGDLELATEGDVPLTTIAQPKHDMGERAVERMLAEIAEGPAHHHSVTVLEPTLVIRESAP